MDRKSWFGVVVCMLLLVGWNFYAEYRWPNRSAKKPTPVTATTSAPVTSTVAAPAAATATKPANGDTPSIGNASANSKLPEPKVPANAGVEQFTTLENDLFIVQFTSFGGAIKTVELKKHVDEGDRKVTLNRYGHEGVFNLTGWDGDYTQVPYTLEKTGDAVIFSRVLSSGAVLKRTYRLGANYQILLDQQVSNPTTKDIVLPEYRLGLGTAAPSHVLDNAIYLFGSYCLEQGTSFHKVNVTDFHASSTFGLFAKEARSSISSEGGPLLWAAVKNQFFAFILSPRDTLMLKGAVFEPVKLVDFGAKSSTVPEGIRAQALVAGFSVPAGQSVAQPFSVYAGPKTYAQLDLLPRQENLVMDSWFGFIVRPLLFGMNFIHKFIPSWGWTIIAMTILIKALLWPLQSIANKSMKQMQALQPKMEQIRQKYKDDPQKMNIEVMQLYKDYGVNPVGGCLPMLMQMPIFIGFYVMLQSAVELRGHSFWWIHDLVQPDTVASFMLLGYNIAINPLPILMTATQVLLMKMTPQTGDSQQVKMMQWMPVVLLFVLYNFAAALALYWTVSNLISMIQTYVNLRRPVPIMKRLPKTKQPKL